MARIRLRSGESVSVDVLVAARRPLGFDFILGMNGVNELGGVTVRSNDCVRFGVETRVSGAVTAAAVPDDRERRRADVAEVSGVTALAPAPSDRRRYDVEMAAVSDVAAVAAPVERADEKDFVVSYDENERKWSVQWKWSGGEGPEQLQNTAEEYSVPIEARPDYERELEKWVSNQWLVPYDEHVHGEVKGTIPLMAVIQQKKNKVRPVMDVRELNSHLDPHTADADVCDEKIREVAPEWTKRVSSGPARCISAGPRARVAVALPDCRVSGKEMVPYQAGFWIECWASGDEESAGYGTESGPEGRQRYISFC